MQIENYRIPIYEFKIKEDEFITTKVPTALFINEIAKIWNGYQKYPEMMDRSSDDNNYNPQIIEQLLNLGIIQVRMVKHVFDRKLDTVILKEGVYLNLLRDPERVKLFEHFYMEKLKNPYIGIFQKELDGVVLELDWLPIPVRKLTEINLLASEEQVRSFNIYHFNLEAYLVSFIHITENGIKKFKIEQFYKIGDSELFYSELESFSPLRINEVSEFLPNRKLMHLTDAWDMFYVARYQYFIGEHPYSSTLDPVVLDNFDKIRTFLIWLNRLQEYIDKVKVLHTQGKTIILTGKHNEMNGEFVSYNTTFTPEIRQEILNKKETFQLYAIANDWYIN